MYTRRFTYTDFWKIIEP